MSTQDSEGPDESQDRTCGPSSFAEEGAELAARRRASIAASPRGALMNPCSVRRVPRTRMRRRAARERRPSILRGWPLFRLVHEIAFETCLDRRRVGDFHLDGG